MEAPTSLDEADRMLGVVETALRQPNFRNEYEAQNAYESNLERIKLVRHAIAGFSGARVEAMQHRCSDLERDWNKRFFSQPRAATTSAGGAFAGEWIKELQAEDDVDELEEMAASNTQKRKQKSKGKRHKGSAGVDLTDATESQRDTKNEKAGMVRGSSLVHLIHPTSSTDLTAEVRQEVETMKPPGRSPSRSPSLSPTTAGAPQLTSLSTAPAASHPSVSTSSHSIETHQYCLTAAIPVEVVQQATMCKVLPLEGTAFAELQFDTRTTIPGYEGHVVYHVQMFRAIVAAVADGPPPQDRDPETAGGRTATSKQVGAASAATQRDYGYEGAPDSVAGEQGAPQDDDGAASNDECVVTSGDDDDVAADDNPAAETARRNAKVWRKMGSEEFEVLHDLSTQVVAEYDAKADTEDELFSSTKTFPRVIRPPLEYLRHLSTATWVVLMCHGGYFAGAVYVNGVAVLHKSFHRYVVRKKQGGKQSSHDKGGGSGGSAGGQIRRGQEIKWKVAVRDLLLEWRDHIHRAWVILFAAPGPDNRAILTDFSLLPASSSNGARERSPVDLNDRRVRSVPLTTHRPTFHEVQRVFDTVSRCTIRIKAAKDVAGDEG